MFLEFLKLILTLFFALVLPGFFFLLAFFGWNNRKISFFEKAVLAVPFSVILINFLVLALARLGILINGPVLVGSTVILFLVGYIIFQLRFRRKFKEEKIDKEENSEIFDFSYWQTVFILISLFLIIFIRATYLSDTIIPSATDLGHHMYWSQSIIDSGHLPDYKMPDFIVGEHIVFAVVNLISGVKIISAMPAIILFLVNIAGIFTLSILCGRMFKNPKFATFSFFIAGVLYAVNAPQAKYISGGVVGNVIGNMLIPVVLYFLFRSFSEKSSSFAGLAIFSLAGLLYVHHLSAFVLLYSIAGILALYLIFNIDKIWKIAFSWAKIFLGSFPLIVFLFSIFYFLFIYTPSYFNTAAVSQATGEPTKITRVGLNFDQIDVNVGSARLILGMIGFGLLLATIERRKYHYAFALGWAAVMFAMSWKPAWLYVNIPSDRIGNYLFLPFSLLSTYGLVEFFDLFKKRATIFFSTAFLFVLLFFVITSGMADSAEAFKLRPQFEETMETFHSAEYLAKTVDVNEDVILKDHVNIYADSWYKLFFMKDYKYPLSRGNLSRYIDPIKPRETCTRDMISEPQSDFGKKCYQETGVNYVVLNAQLEGNSFEKYPEFSKVYGSNYISIFRKD